MFDLHIKNKQKAKNRYIFQKKTNLPESVHKRGFCRTQGSCFLQLCTGGGKELFGVGWEGDVGRLELPLQIGQERWHVSADLVASGSIGWSCTSTSRVLLGTC